MLLITDVILFSSEQCHTLVAGVYKTSCKTGEGVEEMFADIAKQLIENNRSRIELERLSEQTNGFQVVFQEDKDNYGCC